MKPEDWEQIKNIKANVTRQYQAALNNMRESKYSLHVSAKALDAEYRNTVSKLDAEISDFKSRDGKYILLMSDNMLKLKLEQTMNTIANRFLAQILPIASGRLEQQLLEEELVQRRDEALMSIIDHISSGGAVMDLSGLNDDEAKSVLDASK